MHSSSRDNPDAAAHASDGSRIEASPGARRIVYSPPRLTEFGSIQALTQAGTLAFAIDGQIFMAPTR